jgi:uncharacterized protein with PIN domain
MTRPSGPVPGYPEDPWFHAEVRSHQGPRGRPARPSAATARGLNLGVSLAYALARVLGEPLLSTGDDFARTDVTAPAPPA